MPPVAAATSIECFSPRSSPAATLVAGSYVGSFPALRHVRHFLVLLCAWQTRGKKSHQVLESAPFTYTP